MMFTVYRWPPRPDKPEAHFVVFPAKPDSEARLVSMGAEVVEKVEQPDRQAAIAWRIAHYPNPPSNGL
jgi:hypothetical protein